MAIVRLPKGVFSPYTSINTNILFFEKGGPTKDVWFFEHPYPVGYKSYSRSKPLTIGELIGRRNGGRNGQRMNMRGRFLRRRLRREITIWIARIPMKWR